MDLTWLILEETFILMVAIWLAVLLFAPLEHANAFWLTGAIYMITALGAAVTVHGPTSDTAMMVAIQTLVYCLLSSIIFARDHVEPDSDLGVADRLISIAAYLGQLTSGSTQRPQQQPRQQQRRPQHRPPWQRGDQHRRNSDQRDRQRQQHRRQDRGQTRDGRDHADDSAVDDTGTGDLVDDIDEFRR